MSHSIEESKLVPINDIHKIINDMKGIATLVQYLTENGFFIKEDDFYSDTFILSSKNNSLRVKITSIKFIDVFQKTYPVIIMKKNTAVFLPQPSINSFNSVASMLNDFPDDGPCTNLHYDENLDSLIWNYIPTYKIPIIRPHQIYLYSDTKRDVESIKFNKFNYNELLVNKIRYENKIYSIPEFIDMLEKENMLYT